MISRSALYVDGPLLVNDDGLHGMVEKCGAIDLTAGPHVVYIEGFQAGGGVGMVATFAGPDTGGDKMLMKSGTVIKSSRYYAQCDPTSQQDPSQFTICMFRSELNLVKTPKFSDAGNGVSRLYFEGKGRLPVIDLHDHKDFKQYVPATPLINYAWAIFGILNTAAEGQYSLCISSDDG